MQNTEVREIYNKFLKQLSNGNYESYRWSKNNIVRSQYSTTLVSILNFLSGIEGYPAKCLEVGPGPGTWTKILLEKLTRTDFTLVDISEEMLNQAKNNLKDDKIKYIISDFLQFQTSEKFQLFFSSRALEYFINKNGFFENLFQILDPGSKGFLITKTPHYFLAKILGRKITKFHSQQISPSELRKIIQANGFKVKMIKPVTMRLPGLRLVAINNLLFKIFHNCRMNFLIQFLSESYSIEFEKT